MSEAVDRWTETAGLFSDRLSSVAEPDWTKPTPCSEWDVRALVDHAVGSQVAFGSMLGLAVNDPEWIGVRPGMADLLATPDAVVGSVAVPGLGDMTKGQILDICTYDLLIHTWDLSRAIGANEQLPEPLAQACLGWLQGLPVEIVRSPGRFEAAIEVDPDASVQARMLAYAGRMP
jgi:uncharacterized protein (TIGR03083 family)